MPAAGRASQDTVFDALDRMGAGFVSMVSSVPPPGARRHKKGRSPMATMMRGKKTLLTLARLVEQRDHGSVARVERTRAYGLLLAQWLLERLPEAFPPWARDADLLAAAIAVQNVGNISVPPGVLGRAGRLNRHERDMVRSHPVYGATLVDAFLAQHPDSSFLRVARDAAAFHHEAHDGSGYPHGMMGDDIPTVAQLASVVDTFEALTSHRGHRRAYRSRDAAAYILQGAGTRFSPVVVEAFRGQQEALAWMFLQLGDAQVDVVSAPSIPPSNVEAAAEAPDAPTETGVRRVLRDAAAARSGGEVVVASVEGIGRIYMHRGRVAWAHASNVKTVLTQWLVETHGLKVESVREAMEDCKRTGRNFGETLIAWNLIPRERFKELLRQYVALRLQAILALKEPQVLFVPQSRTYATELTFSLDDLA
jgi:hypothetical protein